MIDVAKLLERFCSEHECGIIIFLHEILTSITFQQRSVNSVNSTFKLFQDRSVHFMGQTSSKRHKQT